MQVAEGAEQTTDREISKYPAGELTRTWLQKFLPPLDL